MADPIDRQLILIAALRDRACVVKLFKYITPGPQLCSSASIRIPVPAPLTSNWNWAQVVPSRLGPNSFSWLWKSVLYSGWGACSHSRQPIDCKWSKWRAAADASSPGAGHTHPSLLLLLLASFDCGRKPKWLLLPCRTAYIHTDAKQTGPMRSQMRRQMICHSRHAALWWPDHGG